MDDRRERVFTQSRSLSSLSLRVKNIDSICTLKQVRKKYDTDGENKCPPRVAASSTEGVRRCGLDKFVIG